VPRMAHLLTCDMLRRQTSDAKLAQSRECDGKRAGKDLRPISAIRCAADRVFCVHCTNRVRGGYWLEVVAGVTLAKDFGEWGVSFMAGLS